MLIRELCDFDLKIVGIQGGYRVHLLNSPVGEATHEFTNASLTDPVERGSPGAASGLPAFAYRAPERVRAQHIGARLFDAVIAGDVLNCFRSSRQAISAHERIGLRIKLRLRDVPELTTLPWELLFDPLTCQFLAQSNQTPVVRYVEQQRYTRALRLDRPLNILVVSATPRQLGQIDATRESAIVYDSLERLRDRDKVSVDFVHHATLRKLQHQLRHRTYHVLHFIGHGGFDDHAQQGTLMFEDELGSAVAVGASPFGALMGDHPSLRLVVLNACGDARGNDVSPGTSIATSLVHKGIPAAVAMQFEIRDVTAMSFTREFYACLVEGVPIDAAVAESRKAMFTGAHEAEWATPVLHMHTPDGVLFSPTSGPGKVELRDPPPLAPATPLHNPINPGNPNLRRRQLDTEVMPRAEQGRSWLLGLSPFWMWVVSFMFGAIMFVGSTVMDVADSYMRSLNWSLGVGLLIPIVFLFIGKVIHWCDRLVEFLSWNQFLIPTLGSSPAVLDARIEQWRRRLRGVGVASFGWMALCIVASAAEWWHRTKYPGVWWTDAPNLAVLGIVGQGIIAGFTVTFIMVCTVFTILITDAAYGKNGVQLHFGESLDSLRACRNKFITLMSTIAITMTLLYLTMYLSNVDNIAIEKRVSLWGLIVNGDHPLDPGPLHSNSLLPILMMIFALTMITVIVVMLERSVLHVYKQWRRRASSSDRQIGRFYPYWSRCQTIVYVFGAAAAFMFYRIGVFVVAWVTLLLILRTNRHRKRRSLGRLKSS